MSVRARKSDQNKWNCFSMLTVNSCQMRIVRAFAELIKCWIANNCIFVLLLSSSLLFFVHFSWVFRKKCRQLEIEFKQNSYRALEDTSMVLQTPSRAKDICGNSRCTACCVLQRENFSFVWSNKPKWIAFCLTVDIISTFASTHLSFSLSLCVSQSQRK